MRAALIAVATAPPKRFAGGGYWEAMKGEMTGWFELRVDGPARHHCRLFCLLDYDAEGVDKPLLVVIDAGQALPNDAVSSRLRGSAQTWGRVPQTQPALAH